MAEMPWVVLVTGSRHWAHREPVEAFLSRFERSGGVGPTLIHGGAPGLDLLAHMIARQSTAGWEVHEVPAPWIALGNRKADPARNALMVALLEQYRRFGYRTAVGALPLADSRGTWDCANAAKRAGWNVEVIRG